MTDEAATEQEPESFREVYRLCVEETGSRLHAALIMPIVLVVAGAVKNDLERQERRRKRIKREERWRQEAREEYGETTLQEASETNDNE